MMRERTWETCHGSPDLGATRGFTSSTCSEEVCETSEQDGFDRQLPHLLSLSPLEHIWWASQWAPLLLLERMAGASIAVANPQLALVSPPRPLQIQLTPPRQMPGPLWHSINSWNKRLSAIITELWGSTWCGCILRYRPIRLHPGHRAKEECLKNRCEAGEMAPSSCRGPEFDFQNSHGGSQLSKAPDPEHPSNTLL